MTYQTLFFLMFRSDSYAHKCLQKTCLGRLRSLIMKYTVVVLLVLTYLSASIILRNSEELCSAMVNTEANVFGYNFKRPSTIPANS